LTHYVRIDAIKLEETCLYAKQGRNATFKSQIERNAWLKQESRQLGSQCVEQREQVVLLKQDVVQAKDGLDAVKEKTEKMHKDVDGRKDLLGSLEEKEKALRNERFKNEEERKNLWRRDAQSSQQLNTLKETYTNAKRAFDSSIDRATSNGLKAVGRIADTLGLTDKVYGKLYVL
jgi:structural maintenance of chromosome 3 (chondroitin sulfate proteoglycan 6)